MDAKSRAEKIYFDILLDHWPCGADDSVGLRHEIAAQIEEAEKEAVLRIAERQALVHGESVMLDGKLITNEELYKQPTDYIKEAKAEGFKSGCEWMREEAAHLVDRPIDEPLVARRPGYYLADKIRSIQVPEKPQGEK